MPAAKQHGSTPPWISAFEARSDLVAYGANGLGLFALGLKFNLDDLATVAADAITDGTDDKKCDIIFIDTDNDFAVLAQCYLCTTPKSSAPANKASDLNTAVNWLLQREIDSLPDRIRFSAQDLRNAILEQKISKLHIWYVHNLPDSQNVRDELATVEATAKAALLHQFANSNLDIKALEVGSNTLTEWYHDTQSPILVNDDFTLPISGGFQIEGPAWRAYVTSIPLDFLRKTYIKYGTKLFSANVRDYLGSRSSDSNINNGIKRTAENDASDFWAYNNGLTILVNSFRPEAYNDRIALHFSGMSIVNGAQTTGSVGSLKNNFPSSALVSARFIQTDNQEIVYNVIRYNNSQNKVAASDFRSTDQIQKRLREDMRKIPSAEYEGGRRGGFSDAIRRPPNLLPSYTVGQALAALHGDPTVAYNQKSDIWSSDTLYAKYFNEHTSAAHIVFAYSLLKAVEAKKLSLVAKSRDNASNMTSTEEEHLAFFRRRGSTYLFASALSSLEIVCRRKIPNLFASSLSGVGSCLTMG
jgi:hypothetical protein